MAEYRSGNVFIRPNHLDKGGVCLEHMHEFDHTTFVVKGSVRVVRQREVKYEGNTGWMTVGDRVFSAGQWFLIEKNVKHEITALEDDTMFACIYSHRDPQTREVVQDFNGWRVAYE